MEDGPARHHATGFLMRFRERTHGQLDLERHEQLRAVLVASADREDELARRVTAAYVLLETCWEFIGFAGPSPDEGRERPDARLLERVEEWLIDPPPLGIVDR